MFCSKCGAQLDNAAKFCASCGTPVETPVTNTTPQSDRVDRQAQWNSQWSASAPSPAYNTSPISTQTKKKLQWWHILLIVLGGLILLISIIAAVSGSNDNDNNGGYVGDYGNNDYISSNQDSDVVSVGSIIKFGSYEQDNNYNNGDEDIEWIVLDVKDNKLLLVSKYVLDATQYTYSEYGSTWKDSSANDYLIDNIYTDAFSYQERKKLTTGTIESEEGSFTSTDKVFTLSSDEIQKFADVVSNIYDCYPTEYAKAEGVAVSSSEGTTGMSYWWVRDESAFGTVMAPSSVAWVGTQYKETKHGVRPAIWVDKNYKISTNSGASVSSDMVGTWETVSGGDDHYIEISSNGKLTVYDGNDKLTVNIICYSSTEIAVNDSSSDFSEFVFVLENGKLIRYDETGLPDEYVYAKKSTPSTTPSTTSQQTNSQTTQNNAPKTTYGASSIEELKSILSSEFLFTEKQINCMSMPMFAWTYDECVNQGTQSEIAERNTKEVMKDINDYLFESNDSERLKIKVGTIYECDFDLYSDAYLNEAKSVYGTDVYSIINNEKSKLQGIWGATYTVVGESGASVTVNSNDYEMDMDMVNDFFIYKIDGRYYWSFLELY